jgi:hypothetical protein
MELAVHHALERHVPILDDDVNRGHYLKGVAEQRQVLVVNRSVYGSSDSIGPTSLASKAGAKLASCEESLESPIQSGFGPFTLRHNRRASRYSGSSQRVGTSGPRLGLTSEITSLDGFLPQRQNLRTGVLRGCRLWCCRHRFGRPASHCLAGHGRNALVGILGELNGSLLVIDKLDTRVVSRIKPGLDGFGRALDSFFERDDGFVGGLQLHEELRRMLASQLEEFEKLTRLINQLLLLARAEAGEFQILKQPVALAAVARSVSEQMQPLATAKNISICLKADPESRFQGIETGWTGWLSISWITPSSLRRKGERLKSSSSAEMQRVSVLTRARSMRQEGSPFRGLPHFAGRKRGRRLKPESQSSEVQES